MHRFIPALIATLALNSACADDDRVEDLEPAEVKVIHDHFDGPADQLDAGIELDESELDDGDSLELGAPFIRDQNICVKTVSGAVCTNLEFADVDDRATGNCGTQALGAMWADDCNLCSCSVDGPVCSIVACEGDYWVN